MNYADYMMDLEIEVWCEAGCPQQHHTAAEVTDPCIVSYDTVVRETEKALLIAFPGHGDNHWFPKSQCGNLRQNRQINLPEWLMKKKGLM